MIQVQPQLEWYNILAIVVGAMGSGGLITLFILKWIRFHPMDKMNIKEKEALTRKIDAETDIAIHKEAMNHVKTVNEHLDRVMKHNVELQDELSEERRRSEESVKRIEHLQRKNLENTEEIRKLQTENEQLRIKIERYERELKRRP